MVVSHLTKGLESKLRSFAGVARTLSCCALSPDPAPSFDVEGSWMCTSIKTKTKKAETHTHEIREAFYMEFKWFFKMPRGAFDSLSQQWGV